MRELLVTQCPYCQTRFRLTEQQLSVAAGKVRCGACLEVFQARAASSSPDTPPPPPTSPDENTPSRLADEPDLEALGLDQSIIAELNPVGRRDAWSAPTPDDEALVNEESSQLHADFLAVTPANDFGPAFVRSETAEQKAKPEIDEDPQLANPYAALAADNSLGEELYDDENQRREPDIGALAPIDLLDDVLFREPPPKRTRHRGLWATLSLLALLALPAQFVFYNFDALARDQRSRPLLENFCLLAACELPARVDISQLRSANLLVRPDPEFPNALAIDVIIYNRADFPQPFPVLQMQFTDAGGRTVASRRFRSEEYLSGELAGVELMPTQTPIHVALSMLDPGQQASGYSLEFVSP